MECDVVQGFVLDADYQGTFGYITALTMGSNSLLADLTGKNPMSASTLPSVGVLSEVEWNGEQMDPISFKAQISSVNKQTLAALLQQGPTERPLARHHHQSHPDGTHHRRLESHYAPTQCRERTHPTTSYPSRNRCRVRRCHSGVCRHCFYTALTALVILPIREHVYDEAGNVIETHEHKGDFRQP